MSGTHISLPYKTSIEFRLSKALLDPRSPGNRWYVEGEVGIFGITLMTRPFKCQLYHEARRLWVRDWETPGTSGDGSAWLMRAAEAVLRKKSADILDDLPQPDKMASRVASRHLAP